MESGAPRRVPALGCLIELSCSDYGQDYLTSIFEKMIPPRFPEWTLVLDLDETLLTRCPCATHTHAGKTVQPEWRGLYCTDEPTSVFFRPGLSEFLQRAFLAFGAIDLWSHSNSTHIELCLNVMRLNGIPTSFRRVRSEADRLLHRLPGTTQGHPGGTWVWLKCLKTKGYDMNTTLIVDDRPTNSVNNPGNAVILRSFSPCEHPQHSNTDTELSDVFDYLVHTIESERKRCAEEDQELERQWVARECEQFWKDVAATVHMDDTQRLQLDEEIQRWDAAT